MKPNKQYKAIMLEIEVADKLKREKPSHLTMSGWIIELLSVKLNGKSNTKFSVK